MPSAIKEHCPQYALNTSAVTAAGKRGKLLIFTCLDTVGLIDPTLGLSVLKLLSGTSGNRVDAATNAVEQHQLIAWLLIPGSMGLPVKISRNGLGTA